jgi:hypothetical protein
MRLVKSTSKEMTKERSEHCLLMRCEHKEERNQQINQINRHGYTRIFEQIK